MHITHTGEPLSFAEWHGIKAFILGVDNIIYHPSTGLHDRIRTSIADAANRNPDLAWLRGSRGAIGVADALRVLPLIVDFYRQQGAEKLLTYLDRIYTVNYKAIAPQPDFVQAVEDLRADGRKVVLYSKGPFGMFDGLPMHINKVLMAIGFPPDAFGEKDVVDMLKIDRNPHLRSRFGAGAATLFAKPARQSFLDACETLDITPKNGRYPHVAYLDNRMENFAALGGLGLKRFLVGLCDRPLHHEPHSQHARFKAWDDTVDDEGRALSIGGRIVECAGGLKPIKPRARKPSGKFKSINRGYDIDSVKFNLN